MMVTKKLPTKQTKKIVVDKEKKKTPVKTTKVVKKKTVVDKDVPMKIFTCEVCKKKFPDMTDYFYDNKSKKCMWCTKYPVTKKR